MQKQVNRDAERLDIVRENLDTKAMLIIREQEQVIEAATKGIDRVNNDLKALERRLKPHLEGPYDDNYYEMKERYGNKLAERESLQRAIVMAENSISATKLHVLPGEFNREDY